MSIINTSHGTLTEEKTEIQKAISCIDDVLNSPYLYDETIDYHLTTDDIGWLERAKQAFKKQTPKKPVRKGFGKYCCSVCGKSLLLSSTKFCSECGQAVDWDIVLMTEEECKELVLKEFPEYRVLRIEDTGDYYEVCISKIDGWTTRVLLVKKISGFIRGIGV